MNLLGGGGGGGRGGGGGLKLFAVNHPSALILLYPKCYMSLCRVVNGHPAIRKSCSFSSLCGFVI